MTLRTHLAAEARRFQAALAQPEAAQRRILARFLKENADTTIGRRHRFGRLRGVREFQDRVPIHTYDDLAPDLERVRQGGMGVLTTAPVRALEPTSGSTGANKYIPITSPFLREVQAAVFPWLHGLVVRWPSLEHRRWYTAITPLGRVVEAAPGGPPVGVADDAAWLGPRVGGALAARLAVGAEAAVGGVAASRHATAVGLLAAADLGFISVWSPTFLELLLDEMDTRADVLLAEVARRRPSRARALRRMFKRYGRLHVPTAWPDLVGVSCWCDGPAAHPAARLAERLGGVSLQPKGLLATEGAVSVPRPRGGPGGALAVTSHFLEFVPAEAPNDRPLLTHELVSGGCYLPLLTTGAGLVRYRLGDRVRVVDFTQATPCIEFVGRADGTSDLCGEKLTPTRVDEVLSAALAERGEVPRFLLLAPEEGPPARYVLYLEGVVDPPALAAAVERRLAEGIHYAYCRALGQLAALQPVEVVEGARRHERAAVRRGRRAGTLKPTWLEASPGWWNDMMEAP